MILLMQAVTNFTDGELKYLITGIFATFIILLIAIVFFDFLTGDGE
jgi:hypothetical protein